MDAEEMVVMALVAELIVQVSVFRQDPADNVCLDQYL